jgi:TonB family protein
MLFSSTIVAVLVLAGSTLFAQQSPAQGPASGAGDATGEGYPTFDMGELAGHVYYPAYARKKGIEGTVTINVLVDSTGHPAKYCVLRADDPILIEAAATAVMQTAFTPAIKDGKRVSVWMAIPVTFKLN